MKKILVYLLVFTMILGLTACGSESEQSAADKETAILSKGYDYSTNSIEKGAEYSFGIDMWDMYVATAISDKLIRIVNWSKSSSDKPSFEKGAEIGVFNIEEEETGFIWIDDEHTAFYINLQDEDESALKNSRPVVFTILATDSDKNKGANYSEDTTSYLHEHDRFYTYRAIPLTDKTIKIEAWRCHKGLLWDKVLYAYDVLVINPERTTTDFAWTDDEHTSFSITMMDAENGEGWSEEELVYFIMEESSNELDEPTPADEESYENVSTNDETTNDIESPKKETVEEVTDVEDSVSEEVKSPVFYSTNTIDTVDNGNSGVYSYRSKGDSYDIYWIIDFDEGYVYFFTDGNGDSYCDRLKIDSGDLNTYVKITYHDGRDMWSYKLHFKYVNHAEHLVMNDNDGFDYDYYTTDLSKALALRNSKTIVNY